MVINLDINREKRITLERIEWMIRKLDSRDYR